MIKALRSLRRFIKPARQLCADARRHPAAAWKRLRGYLHKLRRQRAVLRDAVPGQTFRERLRRNENIVLLLTHDSGGGVEVFARQLEEEIAASGAGAIALRHLETLGRYALAHGGVRAVTADFAAALGLLGGLPVRRVIVNSLAGYRSIPNVLKILREYAKSRARLQIWLHDYFPLCPSYHLMNADRRYCGIPENRAVCGACLPRNECAFGYPGADLGQWRAEWAAFLRAADELLVLDASVKELFGRVYPDIAPSISVAAPPRPPAWPPLPPAPAGPALVIGVPGTIARHKGAGIVEEIAGLLQARPGGGNIVVIGELDSRLRCAALRVHGTYRRGELPELMRRYQVTVSLIPSLCPETYSFTADEIMALGLPLACFDLGAQGRKAKSYRRGIVISEMTGRACLRAIEDYLKNTGLS